jgi:hypothetical protein
LENILVSNIFPPTDAVKIIQLDENGLRVFILEIPNIDVIHRDLG